MTRCEQVRGELPAFIAGEPADDGWDSVRSHIGACAPCAEHCASVRRVWGGLAELKFEEVPAGALKRLDERIRAEAGGGFDRVLGLLDGTIAMGALVALSKVVPVHVICRTCAAVLHDTPLAAYPRLGEFTAGSLLSFAALLLVLVFMRFAWQSGNQTLRTAVAGLSLGVLAAFAGPVLHVMVGDTVAKLAWATGALLGSAMAVGVNWLVPVAHRAR